MSPDPKGAPEGLSRHRVSHSEGTAAALRFGNVFSIDTEESKRQYPLKYLCNSENIVCIYFTDMYSSFEIKTLRFQIPTTSEVSLKARL